MTFPIRAPKRFASLLFVAALVACVPEDPTSPSAPTPSGEPLAAKPSGGGGGAYSVIDLGVPVGYNSGEAADVNDAGMVVGTINGSQPRAFARVGNALVALTSTDASSARAVSNGNPTYVVGWVSVGGNSQPARWSISGGAVSAPTVLPNPGYGVAAGVNDQGDVVGGRTIWKSGGAIQTVTPPGDFTSLELTDIDNAGHVVFNAAGSATSIDRAYLLRATGGMIELAPPAQMAGYYAVVDNMSEPTNVGVVYVVGKVQLDDTTCYAALWTVDLNSGSATVTVRSENIGSAWGVSNAGTFAGHQGQGWTTSTFAWPLGGGAIALPMPKGGKNGHVRAVSPNGRLITGYAEFTQLKRHPVLWSGNGP
jgi:hypothetical protein